MIDRFIPVFFLDWTGGVALFGLQSATALGATGLINYRTVPEWDAAVLEQTAGKGASHVLELGGAETYKRSLRALAASGRIVQIGVLTGGGSRPNLWHLQVLHADIIGVSVGSAEHFNAMNAFMATHRIQPIIDKVFSFAHVSAAYEYLRSGQHFGKVVIKL